MVQPCVMACLAHPDDELDIATILASCAAEGAEVALVCSTNGDAGGGHAPGLSKAQLGETRARELACSCERLGIQHLHLLPYSDSGWRTGEPAPEGSLVRAPGPEVTGHFVRLMRQYQPQVVITYGPDGEYNHRDHLAAGGWASAAYYLAGDPTAYPDSWESRLQGWRPWRLFNIAISDTLRRLVFFPDPNIAQIGQVTHILRLPEFAQAKLAAEACHVTQGLYHSRMKDRLSPEQFLEEVATERLMLANDRVPPDVDLGAFGPTMLKLLR